MIRSNIETKAYLPRHKPVAGVEVASSSAAWLGTRFDSQADWLCSCMRCNLVEELVAAPCDY